MIIEARGLTKVHRTESVETTAVNNLDFTLDEGEFVSVMGPSGCGKSTLLHILGLIDTPTSGSYRFMGDEVGNWPEHRRARLRKAHIGFVFQSFNLVDELTVRENIELPLVYSGVGGAERRKRVDAALEEVELGHRSDHLPAQLSGGQQQRVAVARAIVGKVKLICADEPTGNLDTKHGEQVLRTLLRLNAQGTAILMVTHSTENARVGNRIVNLLDGKVLSDGPTGVAA